MLLYFVLGCVALSAAVFPHAHQGVWRSLRRWMGRLAMRFQHRRSLGLWPVKVPPQNQAPRQGVGLAQGMASWRLGLLRRWPWALASLGLLLVPMAAVVLWHGQGPRALEGFDDRIDPANPLVSKLLMGEQLVPPPPLPPELFAAAEVEGVRPLLANADRRWNQMDADFVQRLLLAFRIMKQEHGYDMALLEGWRSPERQTLLAARGANVTMAGAWQSYHQYGLAADCAFYRDGKLVISEKDAWAMRGYQRYGEVAERLGLTWGGRWQMMDLGHVEWRKPGAREAMRAARHP